MEPNKDVDTANLITEYSKQHLDVKLDPWQKEIIKALFRGNGRISKVSLVRPMSRRGIELKSCYIDEALDGRS